MTSQDTLMHIEDSSASTKSSSCSFFSFKRILLFGGIAAVVALALGLGLGLSGSDDSDRPDKSFGCDRLAWEQNSKPAQRSSGKKWRANRSCPDLGEKSCPSGFSDPPLILISLDGFRAEYLTRGLTPNLQRLSDCGVHAPYVRAAYPTSTFPNHYSIVTGLHPESHGIVDNSMYDTEFKERFALNINEKFEGRWYEGEPLWLTAKRQDKKTATMFWPGSDADIMGMYPDTCYMYDGAVPYGRRIDEVLRWLQMDEDVRPDFMTTYFEQPDSAGHNGGPFSDYVNGNLTLMDGIIGDLMDGITELGLDKCVNLVIVADHGMSEVECGHKVDLSDYLDMEQYYTYTGQKGRITSQYYYRDGEIVPNPDPESADEILSHLSCTNYNNTKDWYTQFYKKEEFPKRLHYANHRRIEEVLAYVEEEWLLGYDDSNIGCSGGSHGADGIFSSMHALFLAYGPAFKQQLIVEPFDIIELYNLMTEVMNIDPAPNNGTMGALHHLLNAPVTEPVEPPAEGAYEVCEFPNEEEANNRRGQSDCRCDDWTKWSNKTVEEIDRRLDLTPTEITAAESLHLPHGRISIMEEAVTLCQLTQHDYITGYSKEHNMPLFASYTVKKQTGGSVLDGFTKTGKVSAADCARVDVRLDDSPQCADFVDAAMNIGPGYLRPPSLVTDTEVQLDAMITSNMVPMYDGFREGIWKEALFLMEEYAEKYEDVNVLSGPIFDYNADGKMDAMEDIEVIINGNMPVPSHFFMMFVREDASGPQTMAFVINHKPNLDNCWERMTFEHLQENVIRPADIQLLTGLGVLTDIDYLSRVSHLTHTEVGLWERIGWADAMDAGEECPAMTAEPLCPESYNGPPLLLISLDGFRPDYIQRNHTPTIKRLHDCGVNAPYMRSQYVSHTFPNHYTLVTGMFTEVHGIIDNSMYDMNLEEYFCLSCDTKPDWWEAEPLWNTVTKADKKAMTFFWPGSDVPIQGRYPTEWFPYTGTVPYPLRVAKTLEWLDGSSDVGVADFATLYLSKVDSAGHEGGPNSVEVTEALEIVESSLKQLMDGLYRRRLHQCVNIVVVSDHGMSEISCDRNVLTAPELSDAANEKSHQYPGTAGRMSNEYRSYWDDGGYVYEHIPLQEQVPSKDIIQNLTCVNENMMTQHKSLLPKRLHYARHDRIDDILFKLADRWQVGKDSPWCVIKGQHGYDPMYNTMKAYFSAYGPSFEQRKTVEPFQNIELYNIMAYLLDVDSVENNGTEGTLHDIVRAPPALPPVNEEGNYGVCDYAADDDEYNQRADLTTVNCQCQTPGSSQIKDYDDIMNRDQAAKDVLENLHIPYSPPTLMADDLDLCVLHHEHFVSGYWASVRMALWSAFTLDSTQRVPNLPSCRRPDVRMNQDEQTMCMDITEGVQQQYLFPPGWSVDADASMEALLLSNTVPMKTGFYSGIWSSLLEYIDDQSSDSSTLHVILGPVWDHNSDGRRDANITISVSAPDQPLPSHYFAVMLRCPTGNNCTATGSYDALAFILPHQESMPPCYSTDDYLFEHRARVRDVELLTDLTFLEQNYAAIKTRTFYPEELW